MSQTEIVSHFMRGGLGNIVGPTGTEIIVVNQSR